jgi:hypothetical protein
VGICATIVTQLGPRSEPHWHAPFNIRSYSITFRLPPAVAGARYKDVTVYRSQFAIPNLRRFQQSAYENITSPFIVPTSLAVFCLSQHVAAYCVARRRSPVWIGAHISMFWTAERERESPLPFSQPLLGVSKLSLFFQLTSCTHFISSQYLWTVSS